MKVNQPKKTASVVDTYTFSAMSRSEGVYKLLVPERDWRFVFSINE